ncbi:MAG: DUF418 domain-containing protein [Opitutus sp.]|nr:DUF418 domain-containing protein [Opitutus sp.]
MSVLIQNRQIMPVGRPFRPPHSSRFPKSRFLGQALDTLRGFALLGILLMNIVGFGLYSRAYNNPTAAGGATGANLLIWAILHVLAEGKMRCLFSLVFGASMVIFTSRLEGRPDAGDLYYRRTLWLLLFGIVHAYLLWQGDILYPYALCALALYPFRRMRPRTLILLGASGLVFLCGFNIVKGFLRMDSREKGQAAIAKAERKEVLTDDEKEAKDDWEKLLTKRNPDAAALLKDAEPWHGGFVSVVKARGKLVNDWNSSPYYYPGNFDIWGMMLLGMGLFKFGVLGARKSLGFYAWFAVIGYAVGISINSYTAWLNIRANFDPVVQWFSYTVYDVGRLSIAFGHLGLIMILCQKGWLRFLTDRLGAVGQMAFTNYIMTSVICAFLFTGYGFGLYGRLERYQLYYVVIAISIFQLIASPIWLRHFRFGPLEWCWRSLTYWKQPPFRLVQPATVIR